ncbi:MAG: Bifunctional folylpolyglutamate synthase/dihydrofolate synthase [Candidatus Kapaibacterium sp.]|nr:MAG: Bifunctional folylpolyglutamate synthase/dihydrofolate synthase [Candidatus Kapabacteria bacterium]
MRKDLLEKLFGLRRFGINPGLERIAKILDDSGNPHRNLKAIHIAGTNGKGSVASLLASIYTEANYNVGLYTSPHIFAFNERIKINGKPIPDEALEPLIEKYLPFSEKYSATFFEITTAIAFEYFANSNVDICVVETGLGGRFDATNIIDPIISVITKIDFDHEQYLGKTLEEIATEKAGIIKPNKKGIISFNNENVYKKIKEICSNSSQILLVEDLVKGNIQSITLNSMMLEIETNKDIYFFETDLLGSHQFENIATSVVCVENLLNQFPISKKSLIDGIKKVRTNAGLYGRFELLRENPPFLIDVGHNPNSIQKTTELIKQLFTNLKWQIIFASMSDKNYSKMIEYLASIAKSFLLPNLQYERAERNSKIAKAIENSSATKSIPFILFDTPEKALEYTLNSHEPTLVIGSFYLLAELTPSLIKHLNWKFEISSDQMTI